MLVFNNPVKRMKYFDPKENQDGQAGEVIEKHANDFTRAELDDILSNPKTDLEKFKAISRENGILSQDLVKKDPAGDSTKNDGKDYGADGKGKDTDGASAEAAANNQDGKNKTENKNEGEKAGDKTQVDNLIEVNDDYISKQPEEDQKILLSMKNQKFTPPALKSWLHAQKRINTLKADMQGKPPEPETDISDRNLTNDQRFSLLVSELRSSYPDIPEGAEQDKELFNDFVRELQTNDPLGFRDFSKEYDSKEQEITQGIAKIKDLRQNWETYATDGIKSDVQKFVDRLSKKGIKPDQLGIDLNIDEEGYNEFLYENLIYLDPPGVKDRRVNPQIFRYFKVSDTESIPVIVPGAIFNMLRDITEDSVDDLLKMNSRREGFTARQGHEPPPSLATDGSATRDKFTVDTGDFNSEMGLEEIREKRNRIKQKIFSKG